MLDNKYTCCRHKMQNCYFDEQKFIIEKFKLCVSNSGFEKKSFGLCDLLTFFFKNQIIGKFSKFIESEVAPFQYI